MLDSTKKLIGSAVDQGYLSANYKLIGHRQAKQTLCPGVALHNEIKKWPHFAENEEPKNGRR